MKRFLSLLLCLVLCLSLSPAVHAMSGSCGDDMNWELSNNCLTITGFGAMTSAPWMTYASSINSIEVSPSGGGLDFQDGAFSNLPNLSTVWIGDGVSTIAERAFSGCGNLTYIRITPEVTVIHEYAFASCGKLNSVNFESEYLDSVYFGKGNDDLVRNLPIPPVVVEDPADVTVDQGATATFSVSVMCATDYQWKYWSESKEDWLNVTASDITGAKSATMKVPATAARDGVEYCCFVSNSYGEEQSWKGILTVNVTSKPTITSQPSNKTAAAGTTAKFSVAASNATSYQWQYRTSSSGTWANITSTAYSGLKSATKTVPATTARNGYQFRCAVSNAKGTTYSNGATLTVTSASKPTITAHPSNKTAAAGTNATFKVTATGATSYQWQYRTGNSGTWANITSTAYSGLKSATMTVPATTARNGYQFRCAVSNANGTTYSNGATLTVTSSSKPTITAQPSNKSAAVGATAKFTVAATGATGYQWQYYASSTDGWKNSSGTGAKTATLSVTAESYRNGYKYRCKVSNASGTVISNAATLTVTGGAKPTITTQPSNKSAAAGTTAKFTVAATGATSYQWQYRTSSSGSWNDSAATGAKTATLSISAETHRNGYQYRCKVSNANGTVTSNAATLTVTGGSKPTITTQPTNKSAAAGTTAKFTVAATGATSYQWQYRASSTDSWNDSSATGAKTATLSITAEMHRNGYQYRCKVSNANGSVTSNAATLTVTGGGKPTITTQPKSQTAAPGTTVTFKVVASGATSYQWQFRINSSGEWGDSSAASATTANFSVTAESYRNGYQYRCLVKNANGSVTSNAATLTVTGGGKPTITTQPKSQTASAGSTVTFKVVASNATSYQWQFRVNSSGEWGNSSAATATTASFSVTAESYRNGYQYRCLVKNANGTTISNAATLTVN
ncbi:MAG: leucine-rich repeat protein [Oscillospiraceae bacterium]|nr:leucine-rich repeat protein [Oscillospiraceae bacterium]